MTSYDDMKTAASALLNACREAPSLLLRLEAIAGCELAAELYRHAGARNRLDVSALERLVAELWDHPEPSVARRTELLDLLDDQVPDLDTRLAEPSWLVFQPVAVLDTIINARGSGDAQVLSDTLQILRTCVDFAARTERRGAMGSTSAYRTAGAAAAVAEVARMHTVDGLCQAAVRGELPVSELRRQAQREAEVVAAAIIRCLGADPAAA